MRRTQETEIYDWSQSRLIQLEIFAVVQAMHLPCWKPSSPPSNRPKASQAIQSTMQCAPKRSTLPSNCGKLNQSSPNGCRPGNSRLSRRDTTWIPAKWKCFPFDVVMQMLWHEAIQLELFLNAGCSIVLVWASPLFFPFIVISWQRLGCSSGRRLISPHDPDSWAH